jgi:phosphoenolpyruvate-protein kinase (PTS system EI component)
LGIPAVVNLQGATQILSNGQLVRLNGAQGSVTVLGQINKTLVSGPWHETVPQEKINSGDVSLHTALELGL